MKNFFFFGLVLYACLFNQQLIAQPQKLYTATYKINGAIDLVKDQFDIYSFTNGAKVNLKDGALNINYQLKPTLENEYYKINFKILLDGVDITPVVYTSNLDLSKEIKIEEDQESAYLSWLILTDRQELKGKLKILIQTDLYGYKKFAYGISCLNPPKFGLRERWPYYAGYLVGTGSIITGSIFRIKSERNYNRHSEANTINKLTQEYDQYQNRLKKAENFVLIGAGVLLFDAILFQLRKKNHKEKLKIFQENCEHKSISFQPKFWIDDHQSGNFHFALIHTF